MLCFPINITKNILYNIMQSLIYYILLKFSYLYMWKRKLYKTYYNKFYNTLLSFLYSVNFTFTLFAKIITYSQMIFSQSLLRHSQGMRPMLFFKFSIALYFIKVFVIENNL